ncbi:hypothetical protein BGX33_010239 [Mortierella sp. NVP41]|nr:hypothetical protein BGX33_010239 [Mortierella sp. NVP41]
MDPLKVPAFPSRDYAWIGAILTGVGLFLVVIGIITAHKRRIGYLYLYATLVGLWEILALTHILIICGLIVLPPGIIDPASIVGQKIVEDPAYPLKIAIPVLYGCQWCAWCVTLVCMVSLRLETVDPARGFEIQDPKRHSLDTIRNGSYPNNIGNTGNSSSSSNNNNNNNSKNPWMNQHLFNFRQSVISPIGGTSAIAGSMKHGGGENSSPASSNSRSSGTGVDVHSIGRMNKGKEPMDKGRHAIEIEMPCSPERSWVGTKRKESSDSNAIFIPNDSRVSQVVVTFKNDIQNRPQEQITRSHVSAPAKQPVPEATTIYITNHHYGPNKGTVHDGQPGSSSQSAASAVAAIGKRLSKTDASILNFSASDESLSDMISNRSRSQSPSLSFL